jgi:Domain of unknown function (DUF4272)
MPENVQNEYGEHIQSADEVARRCVVLYAVLAAGHNEPRDKLVAWLQQEGIWDAVSPQKSRFLRSESPSRDQCINATWRAEALLPLLWSLTRIAEMPSPTQLCDVQLIRGVLPPIFGSVKEFIFSARLRSAAAIRDATEEIYQIHWQVRDTQLNSKPIPAGFNSGVVQERHYALNWLTGYGGRHWDDVKTDT